MARSYSVATRNGDRDDAGGDREMAKRLYRSTTDAVVAGVCGGLGKYLGIDPTIVRLFFVLGVWAGISILVYPLLWIVIPREDRMGADLNETIHSGSAEIEERARVFGARLQSRRDISSLVNVIVGGLLVLIGINLLADSMHWHFLRWVSFDFVWPALLIAGGAVLIARRPRTA